MPFNNAIMFAGIPIYQLTDSGGDGVYNVENEVFSKFGVNTVGGSLVLLTVSGDRKAVHIAGLAIDATGLDSDAKLIITLSTIDINARGGDGGDGGESFWVFESETNEWFGTSFAGEDGESGGNAISLGCKTTIKGTGTIRSGKGGGGGGGSYDNSSSTPFQGGSGGGGGAPFGDKGLLGIGNQSDGNDGTDATETSKGVGGAAVNNGGAGGNGGENGTAAQAGSNATSNGGSAGSDGDTVVKNGFTLTKLGSVTYEGDEGI